MSLTEEYSRLLEERNALAARLAEAEWMLRECRGDLSEWCKSYESPHDTLLLMQHIDTFLRNTDSASADCKHPSAKYWETPSMHGYFCADCGRNIEVTTPTVSEVTK
jgi:hypothetical protein